MEEISMNIDLKLKEISRSNIVTLDGKKIIFNPKLEDPNIIPLFWISAILEAHSTTFKSQFLFDGNKILILSVNSTNMTSLYGSQGDSFFKNIGSFNDSTYTYSTESSYWTNDVYSCIPDDCKWIDISENELNMICSHINENIENSDVDKNFQITHWQKNILNYMNKNTIGNAVVKPINVAGNNPFIGSSGSGPIKLNNIT